LEQGACLVKRIEFIGSGGLITSIGGIMKEERVSELLREKLEENIARIKKDIEKREELLMYAEIEMVAAKRGFEDFCQKKRYTNLTNIERDSFRRIKQAVDVARVGHDNARHDLIDSGVRLDCAEQELQEFLDNPKS
jgi:hypothetical protein